MSPFPSSLAQDLDCPGRSDFKQEPWQPSQLLDRMSEGLIGVDAQWRVTFFNRSARQMFRRLGKRASDLEGSGLWEIFPDLVGSNAQTRCVQAMAGDQPIRLELYYPPLRAWFELRVHALGQGVMIFFQETNRKRNPLQRRNSREGELLSQTVRSWSEGLPVGCLTHDRHFRITSWNRAAEQLFGYTQAEVLGRQPQDLILVQPASDQVAAALHRLYQGELVSDGVHENLTRDGKTIRCQWNSVPLLNPRGECQGFLVLVKEVAASRQAGPRLQQQENLLRSLCDGAEQLMWTQGPDGQLRYCNTSWIDYTQRTALLDWRECLHPQDFHLLPALEPFSGEARLRRHDGAYRWHRVRVGPVRNEFGELEGWTGTATDIHSSKLGVNRRGPEPAGEEAGERAQSERFYLLGQALRGEAVWEYDFQCNTWWWSDSAPALLGFARDQIGADPAWWRDHIHPEDQRRVQESLRQVLESGQTHWSQEYRFRRGDGSYLFMADRGTVARDGRGQALRMVGAMADMTHQRLAEEALRFQGQIIDQIHDAVIAADLQGIITTWNQGAQKMFGYRAETILGQPISRLCQPEDQAALTEQVMRPLREEGSHEVEVRLRRESGEMFHAHLSTTLVYGRNSLPMGMIGFILDVTARKVAEEESRRSEARFRSVVESDMIGIGFWEGAGVITDANAALLRMLGYTREEFLATPMPFERITPPEYTQADRRARQEVEQKGFCQPYEKEYLLRNGRRLPVLIGMAHFGWRSDQGSFFVVDLSERRKNEQRLAAQYEVARILSETDRLETVAGRLLEVLGQLLGWDAAVLWCSHQQHLRCLEFWHGRTPFPLLAQASRSTVYLPGEGLAGRALAAGREVAIPELRLESDQPLLSIAFLEGLLSAGAFPIQAGNQMLGVIEFFSRHPLPADAGLHQALAAIGNQIGLFLERKRAEESLQKLNQDLEKRVQIRTATLQETHGQMESFVYSISHDLRAPLRAMFNFAQALEEDYGHNLDDTARDYLQRIASAAQRMNTLTQDLLSYSRLNGEDLAFGAVSLEETVEVVIHSLEQEISSRQARVIVASLLPQVIGHAGTLQLVVMNLLSNALKFTSPGESPDISIAAQRFGDRVRFSIRDRGIGIPPEYHERIFGVFERLHTISSYPGSGVGLAIVRKGIERMGGRVGLESAMGQGSCFWLELNAVPAPV